MNEYPLATMLTVFARRVEPIEVPDENGNVRVWYVTPGEKQWLDDLEAKWQRETEEAYYQLALERIKHDPLYPVMRRKLRRLRAVNQDRTS